MPAALGGSTAGQHCLHDNIVESVGPDHLGVIGANSMIAPTRKTPVA